MSAMQLEHILSRTASYVHQLTERGKDIKHYSLISWLSILPYTAPAMQPHCELHRLPGEERFRTSLVLTLCKMHMQRWFYTQTDHTCRLQGQGFSSVWCPQVGKTKHVANTIRGSYF